MTNRLTKCFVKSSKAAHGNTYDYSQSNVIASFSEKVIIICPIHGAFMKKAELHMNGGRCHACAIMSIDKEEFIRRARKVHGNKYDYTFSEYKGAYEPIEILCPKHGYFSLLSYAHIHHKQGCKKCWIERFRELRTTPFQEFLALAKLKYGNKYKYFKTDYKNYNTPTTIICPIHGKFKNTPKSHIESNCGGCRKCYKPFMSKEEFIKKAKKQHGNKYDYSKTVYKGSHKYLKIKCPIHGVFELKACTHIKTVKPVGCAKCNQRMTPEDFLSRAKKKYNNQYDYSKTKFEMSTDKISIVCPVHGVFKKTVTQHLNHNSGGCNQCKLEAKRKLKKKKKG